ncbi:terminus macrodomain insulation protein YfbV [Psychromonas sp.]|uniref:terminus macrodomain insulation protein YfbV n=1 Tax=Psychromonas sp. TaxID=1884585 RepID=UPI003568CA24
MNLFFNVIREGERYLKVWPQKNTLNCLFIDSKVTLYTRLAIKITPAFIILSIGLSIAFPALFDPVASATFALFLLGLPVQGLYWLGKRSQKRLPNKLLPWFMAIKTKLSVQSRAQNELLHHPCYFELALLLEKAFKLGGDDFLRDHELI